MSSAHSEDLLDRMVRVHQEIAERQQRITEALDKFGVPYALVGGQAVAAWVSTIDPAATRTTKDVDILLDRSDIAKARQAGQAAGFSYFEIMHVGMFLELSDPSPKKAVHIVWTNQFIKPDDVLPTPTLDHKTILPSGLAVISLEWLVKMKLTAWRLHDRVHVRDMLDVGLIDASWCAKLPPVLAGRLQQLIDTPDG